jgi:hypothetical protein
MAPLGTYQQLAAEITFQAVDVDDESDLVEAEGHSGGAHSGIGNRGFEALEALPAADVWQGWAQNHWCICGHSNIMGSWLIPASAGAPPYWRTLHGGRHRSQDQDGVQRVKFVSRLCGVVLARFPR